MKSFIKRWYERDEYLKAFMSLLEETSFDIQSEIAIDIIIKSSVMLDRDYRSVISQIGNYDPRDYNRWYDKNPNIHTAIESLKDLSDSQREEIVKECTDKILKIYDVDMDEDQR